MLQAFSDRIRNSRWLGYAIVAVISVPFALWGIQAYFSGADAQEVAEVNGSPIGAQELDRQVAERRRELREQFGEDLPEGFDGDLLRRNVLDELITQELLTQVATDLDMHSSDERVASLIREQDFFQRDGEFDAQLYRQTLARSGIRPAEYEADMRRTDRLQQLQTGIAESAFTLPSETRRVAMLEAQEREVSVLRIPTARVRDRVSITDADLRDFYDRNSERFRTPVALRVAYIELDLDRLADQVNVTEEEIRAEYERRVRETAETEAREAAHILVELSDDASPEEEEEARSLLERLREEYEEGADFGELAREYSEDIGSAQNGGDLGLIERGDMVEAFDEALFGLDEEGQVTQPIRTRFGYHLIRLTGIQGGDGPALENLRDEIVADLQRRHAEEVFFDRVDDLVNASYENPSSLEPASEALGVEVRRSDWFDRDSGDGIARHDKVRSAAFSEAVRHEGLNSDLIEIDDRHAAVVRVIDERDPQPVPFEEVEDEVRQELTATRAEELRREWLATVRDELGQGTAVAALSGREDLPVEVDGPVRLRLSDEEAGGIGPRARQLAFELPAPGSDGNASFDEVELADGESGIVVVHSVSYPDPEEAAIARFQGLLRRMQVNAELDAWIESLRDDADIRIHERQL